MAYGFQKEAAELVSRQMKAIVQHVKQNGSFQRYYTADEGAGSGERNHLDGLPSLGTFLEALGVQLISPWKVKLRGNNPFPWPVTVKYSGLTLLRHREKTTVVFPDGQTVEVSDPSPYLVSLAET